MICSYCKQDEYVEEDKRTKLKACINLTKSRFSQDNTFYEEARRLTHTENTPTKELVEKVMSTLLVNCNNNVTLMQAAEILRRNPVNPFSNANKELMNLENFNLEGAKNEAQLAKEQTRMEETLEGLKMERGFLEKEIAKEKHRFEQGNVGADFTGEGEKERQKQRQQQQEQQKQERIENEGLKIGNFNINSMSLNVKYGVGLGLIAMCALVIFWFMRQLGPSIDRDRSGRKSR
jgi:hypothetical protein